MRAALPILLACLLCATVRAESPIDVLVVGDVVVVTGVDWVATPDAEPGDVELLLGVYVDGVIHPASNRKSATVALRLARPVTLECYTVADDPADPQRERVTVTPELEPSRWQELMARLIAIETRLEQLAAGILPLPPPPPEEEPLRVDPNTATLDELMQLPGIGPALAQRIIDAREHVVFREPMDLAVVKGIGAATVERLAEFLVFDGAPDDEDEAGPLGKIDEEYLMANPYAAAVLADSPAIYWRGNETSGTTIADLGSFAEDGTLTGGSLNQGALVGDDDANSIGFDGVDDRVEHTSDFTESTSYSPNTVECWVKTTAHGASKGVAWCIGRTDSSNPTIAIGVSNGKAAFRAHTTAWRESSVTVNDGQPHHLVLVVSSSTSHVLYVDGVKALEFTDELNGINLVRRAQAGSAVRQDAEPYSGQAAEFAWYQAALSPERIAAHYAAASAEPSTSALLSIRQRYGR